MQPEPLISIIGVMHSEDEMEVLSLMRVQATSIMHNARDTGLTAELVGEEGQILAAAPVMRLRDHASGCGCEEGHDESGRHYPHLVQAFLKDVAPGAELRIRHGKEQIWSRQAPKEQPRISDFEARLKGEQLVAEWRMESSSEHEPMFWIRWSTDGGLTWSALASNLRGERAELDASTLPGGKVELRLFGSDGFFTAESVTTTVEVPERPLAVSILTPRDGQTLVAGQSMRLWGAAQSDRPAEKEELKAVWVLDGEEVAEGLDVFLSAPSAGEHKLVLQVSMGDQRGETTASFITVDVPPERDKPRQYKKGS